MQIDQKKWGDNLNQLKNNRECMLYLLFSDIKGLGGFTADRLSVTVLVEALKSGDRINSLVDHALSRPRQRVHKAQNEVDERPSDDDVVVGSDAERGQDGGKADTGEARVDSSEHTDVTALELLTEGQFHECHGETDEEEADEVGNEEGGTTPGEAEVGETPEVSEADTVANHGKNEGHATQPARSLFFSCGIVGEAPDEAVSAGAHWVRFQN